MKKTMICVSLLVLAITFLPSCKKQYSCSCTVVTTIEEHDFYEQNGQQKEDITTDPPVTTSSAATTDKVKKKDAASACVNKSGVTESQSGGTVTSGGFKDGSVEKITSNSTCTLK